MPNHPVQIPAKYKRQQHKGFHQSSFWILFIHLSTSHCPRAPVCSVFFSVSSAPLTYSETQQALKLALAPQPRSKTNSENETSSVHSDIRSPNPISFHFSLYPEL
ncbi:hypothetical protein OCU04_000875 [Sclerotinia nivalis]|uniref:Uncharacterized protein n=1 Tax=Sclerotinia nivalis TaxID=352851 RepID=A0A9X0DQN6_9HELO|nr:hypothetical protein OCU04_000875 [Sclerotinia nivalis]